MSKNTRNRILLTALAALLLVTLTIGGTMAWLVDRTTAVTNTFTTSNVDIKLEEENPANQTAKMVPGATIAKDPKVTVIKGSETCWLFVKIDKSTNFDTYFVDYNVADGWTALDGQNGVYYREVTARNADQDFAIISGDSLTVKNDVTNTMMDNAEGDNNPTLTFTAYAIQKSSFATASAAWAEVSKLSNNADHYTTPASSSEGTTVTTAPDEETT